MFYTIGAFLIRKDRLSEVEQSRLFIRGLSGELWQKIFTRLSIKEPDHDPDDYWPLEDIRKAGEYVLNGTNPPILLSGTALAHQSSVTNGANASGPTGLENVVKKEDLAGIMEKFTQQIASILNVKTQNSGNYSGPINSYSNEK